MTNTITLTQAQLAEIVANAVAHALASTPTLASAPVCANTPACASTPAPVDTPAPAPAPAPVRTYEHVIVGFDNFVVVAEKKIVNAFTRTAYTRIGANGKEYSVGANVELKNAYGHKDAWDALKARMRKAGGAYDAQAKAWTFKSAKAAQAFAEGEGAKPITVDELNAVRDKWTRNAEKRAGKAE